MASGAGSRSSLSRSSFAREVLPECRAILANALPVGITYLAGFASNLISASIVGHLGASALASAALATTYANATGYAILYGCASAVDALSSQAVGAGNLSRVGLLRQRATFILLALAVPIAFAWLFCGQILLACGQSPELVDDAQTFIRYLTLGMPAVMAYEASKKTLQAVSDMRPPMVIACVATVTNACLGSYLVHGTPLGLMGSAIANSASQWVMLGAVLAYFRWHRAIRAGTRRLLRAASCGLATFPDPAWATSKDSRATGSSAGGSSSSSSSSSSASGGVSGIGGMSPSLKGLRARTARAHEDDEESRPAAAVVPDRAQEDEDGDFDEALDAARRELLRGSAPPQRSLSRSEARGGRSGKGRDSDGQGGGGDGFVAEHEIAGLLTDPEDGGGAGSPADDDSHSAAAAGQPSAFSLDGDSAAGPAQPGDANAGADSDADADAGAGLCIDSMDMDDVLDAISVPWNVASALSGWPEFLALGVPSAAMLVAEWSSYEVAALIAGVHGMLTLAAHNVITNTAGLLFMVGLGVGVAGSIRVGQRLGERKPREARVTYRAVIVCTGGVMAFNAVATLAVRSVWARVFTDDPAVIALVSMWLPLLALYSIFDVGQCTSSGVLKGIGRPGLAAASNVVSYCVLSLPLCAYLCNGLGWGLPGIWAGFTLGVASSCVLLTAILGCLDWEREAEVAHVRALREGAATSAGSSSGGGGGGH